MQVFISYAHTRADTALTRYLAARLTAVKVDVWLDESSLKAGDSLQAYIEKAIAASDAGIFIVSPSWMQSEWTAFELEQFDKRGPDLVRRIPIFRIPREHLSIPPALIKMVGLAWLEDEADNDARFWELYCALTGTSLGPSDQWSARGGSVGSTPVALPPPTVARTTARLRASLRCDRAPQWKTIDSDLATEGSSEIILVPGAAGQAHEHFLERIQRLLRMDPPRSVIAIDWPTRPRSREEFREAIARALTVAPAALVEQLGQRLTHSNLLLLHPCVRARFIDDALVSYHTVWLPELLVECRPRMNLKCIQPIEWPPESGLASQVLTWFRLRASVSDDKAQAEDLIGQLRSKAPATLRAIRLHDLRDISDDDLNEFCELMNLNQQQTNWFLSRISARNPKTVNRRCFRPLTITFRTRGA